MVHQLHGVAREHHKGPDKVNTECNYIYTTYPALYFLIGTEPSEVDTPMRMGVGARNRPGVVVENSDSLNVPTSPSTPSRTQQIPATSPLPAGVTMSEIDLSSPLNYGTPSSMGSIRTPRSGIRGTPVRARPDIRTDKRMRQVNIGSDAVSFI